MSKSKPMSLAEAVRRFSWDGITYAIVISEPTASELAALRRVDVTGALRKG